jgi:hypothetical protein
MDELIARVSASVQLEHVARKLTELESQRPTDSG